MGSQRPLRLGYLGTPFDTVEHPLLVLQQEQPQESTISLEANVFSESAGSLLVQSQRPLRLGDHGTPLDTVEHPLLVLQEKEQLRYVVVVVACTVAKTTAPWSPWNAL